MLHIPFIDIGKHIHCHIVAGQFTKGNGGNQLGCIGSHNAVHIGTGLSEPADKAGCFVCGDSAADAYHNMFIFKHLQILPGNSISSGKYRFMG